MTLIRSPRACALALSTLMLLATLAAVARGPEPQSAVPTRAVAFTPCPSRFFCLYQDSYENQFTNGAAWDYSFDAEPSNKWFYVGNNANDIASSFLSSRAWTTAFAKDFDANPTRGQWACALGGSGLEDLSNWEWLDHSGMNDSISALYFWTSSGQGGCPQVFG